MTGYRITHTCSYCANIILDFTNTNSFGNVEVDLGVTASTARHAAENECHFFQCVMFHVIEDFPWTPVKLVSTESLRMTTEFKIVNRQGFAGMWPSVDCVRDSPPRSFRWLYSRKDQIPKRLTWPTFRIYMHEDDPAFNQFRYREMFESVPRSQRYYSMEMYKTVDEQHEKRRRELMPPKHDFLGEQSQRQALSWLQQCRQNHRECRIESDLGENAARPERLLKISSRSDMVMLVSGSKAPYAALSYCWGGPQALTLKRSNLRNLEAGIPINLLSPSIQDAIKVTRWLQLTHLWVDALCIVQDDEEDKFLEIQDMAAIYYLAEITIAAGNASSARDGFLANAVPFPSFAVAVRTQDGSLGQVLLQPGFTDYDPHMTYKREALPPLHQRGWTLQEMIFSRRYLHFGPSTLEYHCCTSQMSEGGSLCSTLNAIKRDDMALFMNYMRNPQAIDDDYAEEEILKAWWTVVSIYTGRKLTEPQDKLNGLASLADLIHSLTNLNYIAGLWTGYDLLWSHVSIGSALPRPMYRGPSWSWVSVEGQVGLPISYPSQEDDEEEIKDRCSIQILDGEINEKSEKAPFGALDSAHLIVRGPMKRVSEYHVNRETWKIRIRDRDWGYEFECELDAQDWDTPVHGTLACLDELWLLRVLTAPRSMEELTRRERELAKSPSGWFSPRSGALLLFKAVHSSSFVRRACLMYDVSEKHAWEDSFTLKTVTIV